MDLFESVEKKCVKIVLRQCVNIYQENSNSAACNYRIVHMMSIYSTNQSEILAHFSCEEMIRELNYSHDVSEGKNKIKPSNKHKI